VDKICLASEFGRNLLSCCGAAWHSRSKGHKIVWLPQTAYTACTPEKNTHNKGRINTAFWNQLGSLCISCLSFHYCWWSSKSICKYYYYYYYYCN